MRRFCSVCGKSTEILHEGLCTECYLKEHEFTSIPEILDTVICKRCLRQYMKGAWEENDKELEYALNKASLNEIQHSLISKLEDTKSDFLVEEIKEISKGRFDVLYKITVEGTLKDIPVKEEKNCTVRVSLQLCPDCSRSSGGYYEAILQIRGEKLLAEDEVDKMSDEVISQMEKYSAETSAFISNLKRLKGGIDFYIGSAKIARKISHTLKRNYGGELLETAKLVGKTKSGKNEYRITILLRLPRFKINDIIDIDTRIIQVLNLGKNKLTGFDLIKRKRASFPLPKLKEAKTIAEKEDIRQGVISEVTPESIQLIDMENYKTYYINWKREGLKAGADVEFIKNRSIHILKLKDED